MMPLPVCRWRGESHLDRHVCRSDKFLGAPNLVGADFCARCDFADHPPAPAAPRVLPCVHLGGLAGLTDGRPRPFACALHGRCSPSWDGEGPADGERRCARCPDYLPREPFGPHSAQMRERADAFLAAVPDYPAGRYHGRGVVLVGGGERYFPSLYVAIRALRYAGCRLPVQVWHLGRRQEMPPDWQALLAPYGVECVDADALGEPARHLNGWELKVFAALHSPFEELLFLDADCYPCRDPEFLFDLEEYRDRGAIFWPDVTAHDARLRWPAFGMADPQRPGSVESGQFVLHKRLSWRPLNLTWFYNDHSDYYYRYGHGDKHTFEAAWARCDQPFVMWGAEARWEQVAYLHGGPDGRPLFVHRCADKFRLQPGPYTTPQRAENNTFHAALPLEAEATGWLNELRRRLAPDPPLRTVRVRLPEPSLNGGVIEHEGGLLLAYRRDWFGATLHLAGLDADYQPLWTRPLPIDDPRACDGADDPRLFRFRGRLHLSFAGIEGQALGYNRQVHQMIGRLSDGLRLEELWSPSLPGRRRMEKNWAFFEHEGELYSVYSVNPHVVLRHRGQDATPLETTTANWPRRSCLLRGGAPPVRRGDEYYHFFHTMRELSDHKEYETHLYTFEAAAPFRIRRMAFGPIQVSEQGPPYPTSSAGPVRLVFVCGALLQGDRWLLSYGWQDRECRLSFFSVADIEKKLHPV